MTGVALGLILFSAFVHASWNYLLKKSGGGTGLITAASLASLALYLPIVAAALWFQGYAFQPTHLLLMLGSGLLHTVYFLLLDRAYRSGGDLSIVYPLARATGPLITIVVAVLILGERPSVIAIVGAVLIGASALLLAGNPFAARKGRGPRSAPRHGLRAADRLHDRELHRVGQGEHGDVAHPAAALRLGLQPLPLHGARALHAPARARRDGASPGASAAAPSSPSRCSRRSPTSWCSPRWCSRR